MTWFRKRAKPSCFEVPSSSRAVSCDSDSLLDEEPILIARDLTRGFGDGETRTVAVRDVSLELQRGQFVLLMGPSGSGKSTLLALLSGLMRPDEGRVLVLGQDLWALSETEQEQFRLRNFGYIFQGYNLFPALTALQQLEIVLRWGEAVTARQARERSEEMLSQLGLRKKLHLRPAQLSGGEKQRVAIGRALIKNPAFCFADEPTSALDWEHGEHVVRLLQRARPRARLHGAGGEPRRPLAALCRSRSAHGRRQPHRTVRRFRARPSSHPAERLKERSSEPDA
jgi:putative ABC transport system ATP-binding protein